MARPARYFGLIPAGGVGKRFGGDTPKQYALLGELTVLERSVNAMLADDRVVRVYVVVSKDDTQAERLFEGHPRVQVLKVAGRERANTVLNALQHLLEQFKIDDTDWVLVHDAARPGLSLSALKRLIDEASTHVAGGLLALPVADTLKKVNRTEDGEVVVQQTVPRDSLWAAQTPQMFRAQALALAITECLYKDVQLTDDASAIETMGISPLIVEGHLENMKITHSADLHTVATLLGLEGKLA
ncbi:2-C-methyl-D-erythritol 4-phosphate cytidylyltransferase [Limnobacter humi]|uniref:2-C-methyl-D-erythritol 4-phosphate cytidylyltransferase n=1 Tax=Limnobacter humi TaxID=1778671 RepID=A0ABT1WFC6_9BURK|nr:2-C-methyl-D-erythritol 4-phosphate cytidylyltransferase [Limnobacter humi]MCQ8896222.1 2-C-methyl-D-erythritol 4-phosphate cytidylyltransferase [Limnobacter humi]